MSPIFRGKHKKVKCVLWFFQICCLISRAYYQPCFPIEFVKKTKQKKKQTLLTPVEKRAVLSHVNDLHTNSLLESWENTVDQAFREWSGCSGGDREGLTQLIQRNQRRRHMP